MSTSNNLIIIQNLYKHFAARDNESIKSLFDPNIQWIQMSGFPNGGKYIGAEAIFKNVFSGFREHWQNWKTEITEFIDAGDTIIAIGYYEGTYITTSNFVHADFAHVYTLRNNKISKFVQYTDTFKIAEAMSRTAS